MITSEPNSPTAFANASATPERIPGRMFGKTTRRKVCSSEAPSDARRLLHLVVELEQHRLHRADDERQRHEQQREHDRDARERDVDADRRLRPVEREQGQPGDDRRQRERQVDQRVHDRLAAEVVADEHPGDDGAHHGVDERGRDRRAERQLQRGDRLRARDDLPEALGAVRSSTPRRGRRSAGATRIVR